MHNSDRLFSINYKHTNKKNKNKSQQFSINLSVFVGKGNKIGEQVRDLIRAQKQISGFLCHGNEVRVHHELYDCRSRVDWLQFDGSHRIRNFYRFRAVWNCLCVSVCLHSLSIIRLIETNYTDQKANIVTSLGPGQSCTCSGACIF